MYKFKNYFRLKSLLVFIFSCLFFYFANADDLLDGSIEITANKNMEWDQSENKIFAYGGANVKSNKFLLKAEKITGFYEGNIGKGNIKKLVANTNANFISQRTTIKAKQIDYDFIKDEVNVEGSNIFMEFKEGSINSDESLRFNNEDQKIIVNGNVNIKIKNKGDIKAQTVLIDIDKTGSITILKASKEVEIFLKNLQQKVIADEAKFDIQNSKIDFLGNVVLHQGKSFLKGDKAFVDLKNGISRITSNEENSVSGFFKK
ncbi:MAG: LptA/OstA family protein [Candidatus Puniceispirillales bacterium]